MVRIEVATDRAPGPGPSRDEVERRIVERAEHWAHLCVAERHVDVETGAEIDDDDPIDDRDSDLF